MAPALDAVRPEKSTARASTLSTTPPARPAGSVNSVRYGSLAAAPTFTPFTKKITLETPTLSAAVAESVAVAPSSTVGATSNWTVGGVVSGRATTCKVPTVSVKLSLKSKARAPASTVEPTTASAGTVNVASNGASESVPIGVPPTRKTTDLTPTLSVAVTLSRTVAPGEAWEATFSNSTGGCTSGVAATRKTRSASPVLPAASRATARTWNSVPTSALAGTTIARSNGAVARSVGFAPFTSKRTATTPTSSVARAVAMTVAPGRTCDGNDRFTTGDVASTTVMSNDCVDDAPRESVTTSETGCTPIWPAPGIHVTRPVVAPTIRPEGAAESEKVSGSPSGSLADAWYEYGCW